MQQYLGHDFSQVRVHADEKAAVSARRLAAAAYTIGEHVVFGAHRYRPETLDGSRLLAHELVHVVQARTPSPGHSLPLLSQESDSSERQAEAVAESFNRGEGRPFVGPACALIQRTPEVWFRGEALGVQAARAGAALHDLGDGLYLTNNQSIAGQYATTRAGTQPGLARTLQAVIDPRSLGRVLDLTTDARWAAYVRTRPIPGFTIEQLIRLANENYSRFFAEFLKANNLRIEQFDAIKGPEYVRGGTQLCIRNPQIQAQVRSLLVEIPAGPGAAGAIHATAAVAESSAARSAVGAASAGEQAAGRAATRAATAETVEITAGGLGRGAWALGVARSVAAAVVRGAIFAVLLLGLDYLKRKHERAKFERDMRAAQPMIHAEIGRLMPQALQLQAEARKRTVWVRVTLEMRTSLTTMFGGGSVGAYESFDGVGLSGVTVGPEYVDTRVTRSGQPVPFASAGVGGAYHSYRELVTVSTPIPYDPASLDVPGLHDRIHHNEQDAGRPGLSQAALDGLFDERDLLLQALATSPDSSSTTSP